MIIINNGSLPEEKTPKWVLLAFATLFWALIWLPFVVMSDGNETLMLICLVPVIIAGIVTLAVLWLCLIVVLIDSIIRGLT